MKRGKKNIQQWFREVENAICRRHGGSTEYDSVALFNDIKKEEGVLWYVSDWHISEKHPDEEVQCLAIFRSRKAKK